MVSALLPFEPESGHSHRGDASKCPMFRMLPKELQAQSKEKGHLWEYLHQLPMEKVGVPEYYETLNRGMGDLKGPNLIYPLDNGNFVHIFPDPKDARDYYISVEPGMSQDVSHLMDAVETRLVDFVGDLDESDADAGKRTQLLLKSLNKVCQVKKGKRKGVSNQQKWDTLGAERSGAGWRSGELPEGPVVASSPFGGLSLHLLPAL